MALTGHGSRWCLSGSLYLACTAVIQAVQLQCVKDTGPRGDAEMKEAQSPIRILLPPGQHYPHLTEREVRRKPTKNPHLLNSRLFLPGRDCQGTNGEQQLWGLGPGFVPQLGRFLARRLSHATNTCVEGGSGHPSQGCCSPVVP